MIEGDPLPLRISQATTRNDAAALYAELLVSGISGESPAWGPVNRAIIERWSMVGLRYIKERAWKIAEGKIAP